MHISEAKIAKEQRFHHSSRSADKLAYSNISMASDTESKLLQLCTGGNLPTLKDLITKQGLNPNEVKDPSGLTLLHLACQHGHLDIVQYLINDQNFNPETTTPNGRTPLHIACNSGHLHIIKCLITDHKCNPHCTDSDGYTPLHAASESCNIETVKYLITKQGCDPHVLDGIDNTPLHYAGESGYLGIVQELITNFNCDPQKSNSRGSIPLHFACRAGQTAVARYLIDEHQCSPNCTNVFGNTPLPLACLSGCLPLVKYLIEEHVCNSQIVNINGLTPLYGACLKGHLDTIKYLISDCNCNPQHSTNKGNTPLHYACENGHLQVAMYLITEHKCTPDYGNIIGLTPLYYACLKGHLGITKYLISDCNCNPQCSDKNGNSLLHCACQNSHLEVAKYLITEHKCSPAHGNVNGYTPLHSAASHGHLDVVKYLISELGCNPQITEKDDTTPLHYACLNGNLDITQHLISDYNFDPQCSDKNGNSLLHCACQNGHLEVAKYLITEHKCSPEYGIVNGYTPLHSAAHNGHLAVVKYLISQCNCNPECCDDNGCTPLHEACGSGHLHVTKYLIQEEGCAYEPKAIIIDKILAAVTQKGFPLQNSLMVKAYETFLFVKYVHGWIAKEVATSKAIEGITPLHFACMKGHLETVKYLIRMCKCNPNHSTSNGLTAIDIAQLCGHNKVVSYLRCEHQCSSSWSQALTNLMLRAQENPFEFNVSDCPACNDIMCISPLQQACIIGDLETAKFCIANSDCNPSSAGLLGLTPLHTACMMGHLEIAKYLVFECKCDPNCAVVETTPQAISITSHYQNTSITPLTVATAWGQLRVVKWLVSELKCNQECDGSFPLDMLACMFGQLDVLKYLLRKSSYQDLRALLFAACCFGDLNIIRYLIDKCKCNPHFRSCDGAISLHFACIDMQHLLKNKHQPSEKITTSNFDIKGILLHIWHAIIFPVTMVTQLLTKFVPGFPNPAKQMYNYEILSDAVWANNQATNEQPKKPNLDVVKYLITEHKCNPQCRDKEGQIPLHYACASGQLEIVQYFHSKNVNYLLHTDDLDNTPLHLACKYNQVEVTQFLLSTGRCDPLYKNAGGITPVEIAASIKVRKLLDHFCKGKYPLESVVKVFVLGDPMAGKSSLVQAVQSNPGFLGSIIGQFKKVKGARQQMVGIDTLSFSSSDFGNVVIYDFAGQREFYTSHAAFLQSYSFHVAGIFIVVTDITHCEDDICHSLQYWMSFIQDCGIHNEMNPHVIFVGSHADQVDMGRVERALQTIEKGFLHSGSSNQFYEIEGIVCLDCTQPASPDLELLRYYLENSCNSIRKKTKQIDQRCYVLHKYVHKVYINKGVPGCILKNISEALEGNLHLLPSNPSELLSLFETLHDKGQVLLLKNDQNISNSWVITNIAAMLETVVGSIFAPRDFPQHIAPGSTGIVPKSRISETFPDLNIDMVIGFLEHFEFCHRVEPEWVGQIQSVTDDELYLFPALLTSKNGSQLWQESYESSYCCGWFMYATVEGRLFTTRFLHVLLLRLAFLFAPPQDNATPSSSKTKAPALSRRCNMWKNGISWPDTNGVKAGFEVKDLKAAILRMSCVKGREIYCVRLRTKLIRAILKAKNELCPNIHVEECIVEVAADNILECPSHSIKYLSSTIANRDPNDDPDLILTHSDGNTGMKVAELLYFEPYEVLTPDLITQLFAKENVKKKVPSSFVTELASRMYPFRDALENALKPDPGILSGKCKEIHPDNLGEISRQRLRCKHILEAWLEQLGPAATYKTLKEEFNKYSIFCGRNPLNLVSSKH